MADEPTIGRGDTGEWVTYLQQMLEYRQLGGGFDGGTFCDATEQAVRMLQQQSSLAETGRCDGSTWAALTAEPSGSGEEVAGYETAAGGDEPPDNIAVSIADEMAIPDLEEVLEELDPLPENAMVG
jgi:peptidoglycan hydrolase-like protein with peptidoglycan-binding domain